MINKILEITQLIDNDYSDEIDEETENTWLSGVVSLARCIFCCLQYEKLDYFKGIIKILEEEGFNTDRLKELINELKEDENDQPENI